MHHVRIALDVHQIANFYRSVFAHAAEVIAAEVDQHYVLGALFFIFTHLFFERCVGCFVFATRMRSRYRTVFEFGCRLHVLTFLARIRLRASRRHVFFPVFLALRTKKNM